MSDCNQTQCILSLDRFGCWRHSRGSDKRMFKEDCNAGDSTQLLILCPNKKNKTFFPTNNGLLSIYSTD